MTAPARSFHRNMTLPKNGEIFVFGSNFKGYHGAGAALIAAKYYRAIPGQFEGLQGQSYAIPTKGYHLKSYLSVAEIREWVDRFCTFTHDHPELRFFVTAVGCGYARNSHADIAPLFATAIHCSFPLAWKPFL